MIGLVKAIAWGASGITVNCIAPGFIATAMTDALNDDQIKNRATISAGKMGASEDIAAAALYLLNP